MYKTVCCRKDLRKKCLEPGMKDERIVDRKRDTWMNESSSLQASYSAYPHFIPLFHHIGWNSSKIISRPNSLRLVRGLNPTWAIWCNGSTPKIRVEYGWGQEHKNVQNL